MKQIYITLILCCVLFRSFAQQDSIRTVSSDSVAAPVSRLTLGTIYGNTENYYGQSPEEKLPYLLFYAGYNFKGGFSLAVTAQKLLSNGTGIAATDVSAGYSFDVAKNFTGNLGYAHLFYQKNSPLLETANQNTLNGGLTYNWAIKSNLGTYYSFGTQNDVFVSLRNSKIIELGSLFSDKDYISIEPSIDIISGTVHFYQTYTARIDTRKSPAAPILRIIPETAFGILGYTFSLPLAYNRGSYSIEANFQTSVQGQKFSSSATKAASIFNLSFYYAF